MVYPNMAVRRHSRGAPIGSRRALWAGIFGLCLVSALAGCQMASARFVKKGADEGTIAIPIDNETNREKAHALMKEHFPEGYEITWEEEAKIGTSTIRHDQTRTRHTPPLFPSANAIAEYDTARQSAINRELDRGEGVVPAGLNTSIDPTSPGMSSTTDGAMHTIDRTEWRISYRRKRGGQGAMTREPTEITQGPVD